MIEIHKSTKLLICTLRSDTGQRERNDSTGSNKKKESGGRVEKMDRGEGEK
jgi:hypothetical protein